MTRGNAWDEWRTAGMVETNILDVAAVSLSVMGARVNHARFEGASYQ